MAICPYNASHHVPKQDEQSHLVECRDRRIMEMQKYNEPLPGHHGCLTNPAFYGSSLLPKEDPFMEQMPSRMDDTISSISTVERSRQLHSRIEPRSRRSSRDMSALSGSFMSYEEKPDVPSPLRRPMVTARNVPPSAVVQGSRPGSRRSSPSPGRRVLPRTATPSRRSPSPASNMYRSYKV